MPDPVFFDALTARRLTPAADSLWKVDDGSAACYLVGPALFDPQVNGYAGIDFQSPSLDRDQLEHAVAAIRRAGCSHILLTLITADPDFLADQFSKLAAWIEASSILRETIPGFHLEGPFLSTRPGYLGAHPREHACDPDWQLFVRWQKAAGGRIRMLTLAPELPGSVDFIRRAADEGVFICIGHSDANADELPQAAGAGARLVTHLGNGCPGELHRHDNFIQRALAIPELMASVIPDGIHLPPGALKNIVGLLGPSRAVMTTDAMCAAGAPSGRYRIGDLEVTVGEDRVVLHPNGRSFAGSALNMVEGFYNAMRFGGLGADGAWRAWTRLREILYPRIQPPFLMLPFPRPPSVA